jgi:hypothetical protein
MLRSVFSQLNTNNLNDERPVIELFGGDNANALDSSILWNIINIVLSTMTLRDVINLVTIQNLDQVFIKSKTKLQKYLQETLLKNNNLDFKILDENENRLIYIIFESIQKDLDNIVEDLKDKLKDNNIDFSSSFQRLIKDHLRILVRHIFDSDQTSWGK